MVGATLRMIDPNPAFTAVRASRGKVVRAEPVAALYQQGRRESGEIVGSATLARRGRCFTAPRLFIWGLSISRAPLQAWAGDVLATSLSESGLGDDMAR
jgi:phage terminase large subunit-like protein